MEFSREELDRMIYKAYRDARKNERNSNSQLEFEIDVEQNLRNLREEIYNKTYKPSNAICFMINFPSKREVFAPNFRDRVVSHFIYNILYPMVDPLFIYDSYSCRVGKGTLFGINRFHRMLRLATNNFTQKAYVLSLDISGYFMNINKIILKRLVMNMIESRKSKIITDYETLEYLIEVTIDYDPVNNCIIYGSRKDWIGLPPHKSLFNALKHKGLPIGALTSLLFSNIYLNLLDLYVKHTLKVKYYCRYVDDARIIGTNLEELKSLTIKIKIFLKELLDLDLNMDKTSIKSSYKRHSFLGAVVLIHKRYADNRTLKSFARRVRHMDYISGYEAILSQINSYLGYLSYFRADKTVIRVIKNSTLPYLFDFNKDLKKAIIKRIMIKKSVWGWEPPKYEKLKNGNFRVYFDSTPRLETRIHRDMETEEETEETITVFDVKYIEKDIPELKQALNNNNELEFHKVLLLQRIMAYDSSDSVNEFKISDYDLWLDKATRVGLVNSVTAEKESGASESTLWAGDISFTINCDLVLVMLKQLELYAIACYNKTAEHLKVAKELTTIEELDNYDYKAGYPEKLVFSL